MGRFWLAVPAFAIVCSCGGGGDPAPSVKSNTEEVQGRRDEIKSAGDAPAESSGEVLRLLQAMDDPDPEVRWRAEFALGRSGPRGIKSITSALRNESPKIRFAAAFVLGPLGRRAKDSIPALLESLGDPEPGVRVWAAHALGAIDPEDSRVLSALTKSLRDTSPDVRRVILPVMIALGPRASGAASALTDLLQDADAGIRATACIALGRIGPDAKTAAPALVARLSDPDPDVRDRAGKALSRIGPDAVMPVARALSDRDAGVRRLAASILGSFGGDAKGVSAELTDAAKDGDPGVQKAAAEALKRIQNDTGDAQPVRGTSFIEAPEVINRRMAGFKWAKVGLFVHWGLYSVAARAKAGQVAEAVMENDRMSPKDYERLALNFRAEKFKPEEWAKLANETGARYLILTAKERDGFCLWNSKLTDYHAARVAAARRDLLGELASACDKEGVKFCAAYSLADRHHPDARDNFPAYVEFVHGQIKELLTGYPLWGVWLDGESEHPFDEWRGGDLITMIRQTKPAAFINDRLGTGTRGTMTGVDFYTTEPELSAAALRLQGRPTAWERRSSFGDSASYDESPDPLRSGERMILDLVDCVSRGGNFVMSIGPRPDGTIPDALQERMKIFGAWLQKNADSIYDTERSPFNGPLPAGKVTCKGTRLFVFLEEVPRDGIIALPGLKTKVREAWVLDGKRELKVRDAGIQAPDLIEGSPVTVVAIELEGPPEVTR
jgi:alpha-L-fucosidase